LSLASRVSSPSISDDLSISRSDVLVRPSSPTRRRASACMQTRHTNAHRATRLMAAGASAAMNIRPRPTQAARADTCRNFIVGKEATAHKRSLRSAPRSSPSRHPLPRGRKREVEDSDREIGFICNFRLDLRDTMIDD